MPSLQYEPANRLPRSGRDGFTMVELLVCMAISTVLVGVIAMTFHNSIADASQAEGVGASESATLALRISLARDAGAVVPLAGISPSGGEEMFRCVARDLTYGGERRLGILSYVIEDERIVREWVPLPKVSVQRRFFPLKSTAIRYMFGADEAMEWSSTWHTTNLPAAIQFVLPGEGRAVTAVLQ